MTREPRDDAELVRAHLRGDDQAFGELFRRHRDRLWAVAMRVLGDREEAADALQDALISAYQGAARFRGDSAVTTWLHRIVVNTCIDRMRRRRVRPTVPLAETEALSAAGTQADSETTIVVRQALSELPFDQRAAVILIDMEGYSVAEAAAVLGVAQGTVKSRCFRGRARLAMILGHLRNHGDNHDVSSDEGGGRRRGRRA